VKWDRTGLGFLNRIRKGEYSGEKGQGTPSNIPIIVLSAVVDSEANSEWRKTLQNEHYLEKPFRLSDLQNLMHDVLQE
jgi:response regulator RpfG family c-di-GMP phosphodiesterase